MYTYKQLETLKARLDELNCLKSRLATINAHDMSFKVQINVRSKTYSFTTEFSDKAVIDILKNSYESKIKSLENMISSTTILSIDAL